MITTLREILADAEAKNYALGAFNVYNLEGVKAVINAAEQENSPVMLQLHPAAFKIGGVELIATCLRAAEASKSKVLVHLDHASSEKDIELALSNGIKSIMADGSIHSVEENYVFTQQMSEKAHSVGALVEAELGRLSGTEDGLTIAEYDAKLTDPEMAVDFVQKTNIDSLAVCIGNVHGHYPGEPKLDFDRLEKLNKLVNVPLVMHGASGLSDELIQRSIDLGIRKFNINTEVRDAYMQVIRSVGKMEKKIDLVDVMALSIAAMQDVIVSKLRQFRSNGKL